MRLGQIRVDLERAPALLGGLGMIAQVIEDRAQVATQIGTPRGSLEGSTEQKNRLFPASRLRADDAQDVRRIDVRAVLRQDQPKRPLGVSKPALSMEPASTANCLGNGQCRGRSCGWEQSPQLLH